MTNINNAGSLICCTADENMRHFPSIERPWLKYYSEASTTAPLPQCSVYDYLWENNKDKLDEIAIVYFGRRISYGELFENIDKTADAFLSLGVHQQSIVTFVTVTTPETIYCIYALNKIGAISNMIDPRTSSEGIHTYFKEVNSKIAVTLDVFNEKVQRAMIDTDVDTVITVSPFKSLSFLKRALSHFNLSANKYKNRHIPWHEFIDSIKPAISFKYRNNPKTSCAVIVHTGGTTGTPKGVMLSDYALNSTVVQCDLSGFNLKRGNRWLGIMPPFIAYGIANGLHLPLCKGMTLIVIPFFKPKKYDKLLLKYKPSYIVGVPSHYGSLINSKRMRNANLSTLIYPVVGGDGIEMGFEKKTNSFLQKHNCSTNLIKGYGMTEICAAVCATAKNEYNKVGSVGIPFTHSVVSVFNPDTGEELSYYEEGEICMQGPHIMLGYYNNADETKRTLRTHKDGSIWLHSGDIGYIDDDGCVFILGRMKRMIVRHDGFKVFPFQIESVVSKHHQVKRCCSIGTPDNAHSQGQLPLVFVQLKDQCTIPINIIERELKELCRKELPEYAIPTAWKFIDELPLTSIGKVDYNALTISMNEHI